MLVAINNRLRRKGKWCIHLASSLKRVLFLLGRDIAWGPEVGGSFERRGLNSLGSLPKNGDEALTLKEKEHANLTLTAKLM